MVEETVVGAVDETVVGVVEVMALEIKVVMMVVGKLEEEEKVRDIVLKHIHHLLDNHCNRNTY